MQDIQAELAREAREQEMMRMTLERKTSSSVTSSTRGGRSRDISSDRGCSPNQRASSPSRGPGGGSGGIGASSSSDSPGDDGFWEGSSGRGRKQRSTTSEVDEGAVGGRV